MCISMSAVKELERIGLSLSGIWYWFSLKHCKMTRFELAITSLSQYVLACQKQKTGEDWSDLMTTRIYRTTAFYQLD